MAVRFKESTAMIQGLVMTAGDAICAALLIVVILLVKQK